MNLAFSFNILQGIKLTPVRFIAVQKDNPLRLVHVAECAWFADDREPRIPHARVSPEPCPEHMVQKVH